MAEDTRDRVSTQSESGSEVVDQPSEGGQSETTGTKEASGGQGSDGLEEIVIQPGEGARDFTSPYLKGKSPEEIERLFELHQETIRSQSQELNNYHSRLTAAEQASAPPPKKEEVDDGDYGDSFIAPAMRRLEDRLSRRLEEMVGPLRSNLATSAAQSAREKLRGELRHFTVLEPHIDRLSRSQNLSPDQATEAQLRVLYHTVLGAAIEQGVNLNTAAPAPPQEPRDQPRREEPVSIPQRRPSSAPLPEASTPKKGRPLTELERRLAREYNMTEEQYLEEMSKQEDEIVSPGFSKDQW